VRDRTDITLDRSTIYNGYERVICSIFVDVIATGSLKIAEITFRGHPRSSATTVGLHVV